MGRYGEIKMSEVARRAGVSGAAVSRYLNDSGYLSKEKREAIRRAIEELGFEPPADHASRYPRCKTFGILLPPFQYDGYGLEMKAQFTRQAEKAGYHVLDCYFDLSRVPLIQALESICRERVCGIFVPMLPMMKLSDEEVDYLRDNRVPVVLISEFADSYPQVNCILRENDAGAMIAVKRLLEAGCRHLAYLGPPPDKNKASAQRLAGFWRQVRQAGLDDTDCLAAFEPLPMGNIPFAEAGYKAAKEAFARRPDIDGILGWNDAYLAGALWRLAELEKRVPRDVKVIAFHSEYAPFLCPPVSSVEVPTERVCAAAVELLARLQDPVERMIPRQVHLCPALTERASV